MKRTGMYTLGTVRCTDNYMSVIKRFIYNGAIQAIRSLKGLTRGYLHLQSCPVMVIFLLALKSPNKGSSAVHGLVFAQSLAASYFVARHILRIFFLEGVVKKLLCMKLESE
jgi:hypothetical protein